MLQAKNQYGHLITPALLTSSELKKLRPELHNCPLCQHPVILRAGPKVIPHFAHRAGNDCPNQERGEGIYHERGKLMLYNWLQRQFPGHIKMETWLAGIRQRPDLYLTIGHRQIAIEYQCARIPISEIKHRNKGYAFLGITPIWILGGNHFKRIHRHHFRLNAFLKHFIHSFSHKHPNILFFYHPETNEMAILKDIYETDQNRAIGKLLIRKLSEITFTDLFTPERLDPVLLLKLWQEEKQRFRFTVHKRLYGINLAWHQWLYERRTHRERLPSIVYLPVANQHLMKTPLWNWQSRLCIDLLIPLPAESTITLHKCLHYLRGHYHSELNATTNHHTDHPVKSYFSWLVFLEIMIEVKTGVYKKQKQIGIPDHIESAVPLDKALLEKIAKKLSTIKA